MYVKKTKKNLPSSCSLLIDLLGSPQERPASMRKSLTPGRTPLKSWKDRLAEQTSSPVVGGGGGAAASPLRSPRPALGSLGSPFGRPLTSPFAPRYVHGE